MITSWSASYGQEWLASYQNAAKYEKKAGLNTDSSIYYYCAAAKAYYETYTTLGHPDSGAVQNDSVRFYYSALESYMRCLDSLPAKSCIKKGRWASLAADSTTSPTLDFELKTLNFRLRCAEKAYALGWHKAEWLIAVTSLAHYSGRRDDETVWLHRLDVASRHFSRKEKKQLEEFYKTIGLEK